MSVAPPHHPKQGADSQIARRPVYELPPLSFRSPEKGAFARGALRKFVANCAPNLRKIAGNSFRASEEGCAKSSHICQPSGPAEVQCEFFGPVSGLNFGR